MKETIRTRTTLLERLKDWRDDSSWQEFFDIYWLLIYRVALKSGLTDAEAKDVVQETMVAVAKYIPAFKYDRSLGSFKGWLLNMARWRIADQLRKRSPVMREPAREETDTGTEWLERMADPASLVDLEKWWDDEWEKNLVDAAVTKVKRRLEPEKYQVFDCYMNKQWPAEKVASTFGISVNQVYLAKHRVTDLIKEEVERLRKEMI